MNEKEIYKLYSQILNRVSFKEFMDIINDVFDKGHERGYINGCNEMLGSGRDFDIRKE